MLANTPQILEAHYGVPMTGAVLCGLNTRLDPAALAFILDHGEAKVLITDREFAPITKEALKRASVQPLVIDVDDKEFPQTGERLGTIEYEEFLAGGDSEFAWQPPEDEWDAIALNYTSGTTGNPKGVVFHHRGAALMGYGNVLAANLCRHPVYLWTLPIFHCNGWCFPWTLSVVAGTHVCLRWVRAKAIYEAMAEHGVTHLCGAPIVMKGYLKNPSATKEAFAGGWFHSGDLGVLHPDGYIQLKDRSKDIIISGGENISSIEVEDALLKHPAVMHAAVVAKPDDKWGETPCAFVERKPGHEDVSEEDLIAWCRDNLAHYKCPRHIVFCELPKTSTGKIQKFKLRDRAKTCA